MKGQNMMNNNMNRNDNNRLIRSRNHPQRQIGHNQHGRSMKISKTNLLEIVKNILHQNKDNKDLCNLIN